MDAWQVTFVALFVGLAATLAAMTWLVQRQRSGRARDGLREWCLGLGLQVLAWPLFAVPVTVAGGAAQALASGLLLAGLAAMLRALLRGLQARPAPGVLPTGIVYLPPFALTLALSWPGQAPEQRIALFWGAALLTLLLGMRGPLRGIGRGRPWPERAVILIFGGAAVICLLRLLEQLIAPRSGPAFDASITVGQQLALAYFLVAPLFATFAFVLMQFERQQRWLEGLATEDALTGIHNRRAFVERAQRRLSRPDGDGLVALLMIDADGFKTVNDRHGHAVGDRVLAAVADAMRTSLRTYDIAGRLGGDEFCMLLMGVSPGEALQRAEALRRAVAAHPVRVDGDVVAVTLSIGIAHVRAGRETELDRLLAIADRRLYLAKRAGRNRVIDRDVEVAMPPTPA